ncbi:MAG: hypothetical protein ACI8W9_001745, partial [Psychromonas sp.]
SGPLNYLYPNLSKYYAPTHLVEANHCLFYLNMFTGDILPIKI